MGNRISKNKSGLYVSYILLTFLSVVFLAPFFFMLISSFKPGVDLMKNGLNFKINFDVMTFNNYKMLFFEGKKYLYWYRNSLIITALHTILTLFFTSMVGYGLAVYNFKGRNLIFIIVLLVMMVPIEILLLPLYKLMIALNLIDTYMGVVLPFVVSPFAIFFFRQYVVGLPKELIDAARIDGCSEFGIFIKIMAPLMKPAFGAMAILEAMTSWNGFIWPLIVLRSTERFTLPVGLASLMTPYGSNYDMLMSGAVMSVVPIAVVFLLNQRMFVEGLAAGSIKQ
jgi:arabinosaccharide transport system permease protein